VYNHKDGHEVLFLAQKKSVTYLKPASPWLCFSKGTKKLKVNVLGCQALQTVYGTN
jgi:hydroxyacyl-ACP dehydratase HTD2-like protein with hotdog domain